MQLAQRIESTSVLGMTFRPCANFTMLSKPTLRSPGYPADVAFRRRPAGIDAYESEVYLRYLNSSGRFFFNPFAIFSIFTSDTFLTPLSTPL